MAPGKETGFHILLGENTDMASAQWYAVAIGLLLGIPIGIGIGFAIGMDEVPTAGLFLCDGCSWKLRRAGHP